MVSEGNPVARAKASGWMSRMEQERASRTLLLREQRRLAPSEDGVLRREDEPKPWSYVYSTIDPTFSLQTPRKKDKSRQREVIAKLREREMGRAVSAAPAMDVEPISSPDASNFNSNQEFVKAMVSAELPPYPDPVPAAARTLAAAPRNVLRENDSQNSSSDKEFEKMVQELKAKREQLSRIMVQQNCQGSTIHVGKLVDTANQESSPLYQVNSRWLCAH
mmetsp:Transcript_26642/g.74808  ORF Transcript_26642/g.74808 Transcript_26642/m.74808 type:complete len:220 (+) Transcript_26642:156-815(+)